MLAQKKIHACKKILFFKYRNNANESPAEILIHELVVHAIPRATGWHGNAVDNENIVRVQCNLKLRRSERNHPCF